MKQKNIKKDLLLFLYEKKNSHKSELINDVFADCELRAIDIRNLLEDLNLYGVCNRLP